MRPIVSTPETKQAGRERNVTRGRCAPVADEQKAGVVSTGGATMSLVKRGGDFFLVVKDVAGHAEIRIDEGAWDSEQSGAVSVRFCIVPVRGW